MKETQSNKPWQGRFTGTTAPLMEKFNASIDIDKRLYQCDIKGSIAHAKMLKKIGILDEKELSQIIQGLTQIEQEIVSSQFDFKTSDEDIHMAIEKRLIHIIGPVGGKLHTARSRNDQVATDTRLYLKERIIYQRKQLKNILIVMKALAEKYQEVILPGFTHLQAAQPVTLAFYLMAYFQMFKRDYLRLNDCLTRMDESPLGSGALAGVNYSINREMTGKLLGFDRITENAMDAVSDRDYMIEYLSTVSIIGTHLSRLNEELIIWSNPLFNFIAMDDAFATGSSIMPNKKNPDACELLRGKTARLYGNLGTMLTLLKSLPLAYNKDLQEDKECLFDSIDQIEICLEIIPKILQTMKIKEDKMLAACESGFLQATDVADYLVNKGIPFRDAHEISGRLVSHLETQEKNYSDLALSEYQAIEQSFQKDIFEVIKMKQVVANKQSIGGTGRSSVKKQISSAKNFLKQI